MRFVFYLLMLVLVSAAGVVAIVYLLARVFSQISLPAGTKAWERMVKTLRGRLQPLRSKLIDWEQDSLALLSLNRQDIKKPGWMDRSVSGIFTTIYHEPVLAFMYQPVGKDKVILVQTKQAEFVYRILTSQTEIWYNSQALGILRDNKLYSAGKVSNLLAALDTQPHESLIPLSVHNQSVAALQVPSKSAGPNPRALTLLRELNTDEQNLALALTALQMAEYVAEQTKK